MYLARKTEFEKGARFGKGNRTEKPQEIMGELGHEDNVVKSER